VVNDQASVVKGSASRSLFVGYAHQQLKPRFTQSSFGTPEGVP